MPVLETKRESLRFELPSSTKEDPAWVEIYQKIMAGDILDLKRAEGNFSQTFFIALSHIIKEWNFTDASGEKVPVTEESVQFLDMLDLGFIAEKAKAFKEYSGLSTVKKNSFSSALQPKKATKKRSPKARSRK